MNAPIINKITTDQTDMFFWCSVLKQTDGTEIFNYLAAQSHNRYGYLSNPNHWKARKQTVTKSNTGYFMMYEGFLRVFSQKLL